MENKRSLHTILRSLKKKTISINEQIEYRQAGKNPSNLKKNGVFDFLFGHKVKGNVSFKEASIRERVKERNSIPRLRHSSRILPIDDPNAFEFYRSIDLKLMESLLKTMVLLDLSKTSCHSIWEVSRADGNKVFYGRIIETDRDQISSVEGIFIKSENASPSYYLKEGRAIDKLGNKETGKWSYSRESGINFLCKGKRETKNDVQIGVFEPNVTLGSSILVAGTRKTKQTKIEEGTFVYSKETNAVELNEGSRYYTNSSARVDGIFKYSSELKQHLLVNGRVCLSNGAFKKGIFEYDSTKERIRFKEGTYYDKNGNKYHGKFTYNSFLKTDILNDGIHCFEKGVVSRNGTFEFDHENHKLLLIDGRILLSTGQAFFFKDGQIVL